MFVGRASSVKPEGGSMNTWPLDPAEPGESKTRDTLVSLGAMVQFSKLNVCQLR